MKNKMRKYLLFIILIIVSCTCFSQIEETDALINLKGQAITTITNNTIAHNYGRTLAQLLNEQPGIIINGAYQPMGSFIAIYMEGTMSGRALILIDNIPVWDPSTLPDYYDINLISLYDIERIDIYHGTQSSTMGNGAFAGAINIITTKKDGSKLLQLHAVQSFGNQHTSNSQIQVWGQKDKWNYSAGYSHIRTTGFSDALDSTGLQNFDKDGYEGNVLTTHLSFSPDKYWNIKAFCLYSQYKADADVDSYTDALGYYYNKKLLNTGTGFTYHKKKVLFAGKYQYSNYLQHFHYDDEYHENYHGQIHFVELYGKTNITSKITLLAGIDLRAIKMDSQLYDTTALQPHNYPAININSLYGKLNYTNIDSSLSVDVAGRASRHSEYGSVYSYNISGTYRLIKGWELFAGIATGFKSPCLYQLYNNYGSANSSLVPEKTLDYHVGISVKQNSFTQKLRLYYYIQKDLIYWDNNIGGYDNFNQQKTWGLQYELDWKITKAFGITANYTLTKGADYTVGHENYTDVVTYPYLFRRPEHVINGGIHYTDKILSLGITARYVSDYYDINYGYSDYIVNHFVVFNAYSNCIINQHWQLFANAQNILNNTFYDVKGCNSIPFLINGGIKLQL